jgi:cell pole-organizing protein PopZ
MEEILASIRRILKEDDGAPEAAPVDIDDDVLVLDDSMIVSSADVSTATSLPASAPEPMEAAPETYADDSAIHAAAEPALVAPAYIPEPVFAPEPEPEPAPQPWSEPAPVISLAVPEPEPASAREPESEPPAPVFLAPEPAAPEPPIPERETPEPVLMEPDMPDQTSQNIEPPDGLLSDSTTDAAASSIGAMVRSITKEKAVAVNRSGLTIEDIVREEIKPLLKSWLDAHLPSLVERVVRSEIERVIDRSGT